MRIVLTTSTCRQSVENVTSLYVGPLGSRIYVTTSNSKEITIIKRDNVIDMIVEFNNVNQSIEPTPEKSK
jgi:hypothetical protein